MQPVGPVDCHRRRVTNTGGGLEGVDCLREGLSVAENRKREPDLSLECERRNQYHVMFLLFIAVGGGPCGCEFFLVMLLGGFLGVD